jgi:hypothetical protein
MNKTDTKRQAQDLLMQHVANALGYWDEHMERRGQAVDDPAAFQAELRRQADRIAKLFGYEEAWSN